MGLFRVFSGGIKSINARRCRIKNMYEKAVNQGKVKGAGIYDLDE